MTVDLNLMPPVYVRCRTFGHAWNDVDPTSDEADQHATRWPEGHGLLVTDCMRCSMRRLDVVGVFGKLINRRYVYPEGYLMSKGDHRPKRDEFRMQLLANRLAFLRKRGKA